MRSLSILSATAVLLPALAFAAEGDWPRWRGPNDDGMARGDAPLTWSAKERVAWKVTIPGRGHSSPVIWGNRIFVTTAVPIGTPPADAAPPAQGRRGRGGFGSSGPQAEHRFLLLCFDRKTGALLWERVASVATPHQPYHQQYGSFASNSPITEGKHVIASFGSRGVYAYTLDGQLVWQKDLGQLRMFNNFGEGAWPALDGDKLVLVWDHEDASFVVALDKTSGRELWRTPRQGNTNWSGAYITSHNGKKIVIVSASREVCAYDLETGAQIWKASGLGQNTIPSPVAADGLVHVMSGFRDPNMMTIRLGREGDLTGTDAIVWQNQRGNPYTASPVLHDGKLYVITDSGMLSCFDAKTGKPYYQIGRAHV